jgi:hypothetical protein
LQIECCDSKLQVVLAPIKEALAFRHWLPLSSRQVILEYIGFAFFEKIYGKKALRTHEKAGIASDCVIDVPKNDRMSGKG